MSQNILPKIHHACESDVELTSFSNGDIENAIMSNSVLRYYFALNGGAGPVSAKGYKIFRAIELAIREHDQQKTIESSAQNEGEVEFQVWRSAQPSFWEQTSEDEYLGTNPLDRRKIFVYSDSNSPEMQPKIFRMKP